MYWFSQVLLGQNAPFHCSLQFYFGEAKLFVLFCVFCAWKGWEKVETEMGVWKGWENVEIKMGVGEGESERQGLVIAENSNKFLSPFRTLFAERSSTWMKDGGLALAINLGISLPVLSSRSKNTKTNTTDGFQSLKSTSSIIIVLHFSCILVKQKKQRWGEWVRARDREG